MSVFTPVNQVRLTNVATVRLQKRGKRFEIACYRNKVLSWRNKLETNLREVLQIDTVFTNVSKGLLANTKDLMDAFGSTDQRLICQEILDKGELQVSEQERGALYETIFRDIASIVVDKTVNPENNKPYTVSLIQSAMKQIQYSVNVSKSSKSQALEVIRKLRDIMPIARASMLLRVIFRKEDETAIFAEIEKVGGVVVTRSHETGTSINVENNNPSEEFLDVKIDPEFYRKLEDNIKSAGSGRSRIEVLQMRMASTVIAFGGANAAAGESKEPAHYLDSDEEQTLPKESSKPSKKKSSSKAEAKDSKKDSSSKRNDDLQHLLSEVTGINDLVDEEAIDEYEIATSHLTNQKKSKKKDKAHKAVEEIVDSSLIPLAEESSNIEPEKDENVSIVSSKIDGSKASEGSAINASQNNKILKKSKKDKKLEKDELQDKEREAKLLQERILAQKKKSQEEQSASLNTPSSSTNPTTDQTTSASEESVQPSEAISGASASAAITKIQSCNTCGGAFHDTKEYREHFKSEWHRFNLKRKMKNLPLIPSEIEFLQLSIEELQI